MKLNIDDKNIWQIGSGDSSRDYSRIFLEFGVALVGPGNPGDHREVATEEFYKNNPKRYNWGKILSQVKKGDWIILRNGQRIIKAVGEVISDYDYHQIFGDIDGWDLQHLVNVNWFRPLNDIVFKKSVLVRITLARCYDSSVIEQIKSQEFDALIPKSDYRKLAVPDQVKILDISQSLIDFGIRIQDAENVAFTIDRIIKLTKWYHNNDYNVLEHEIRTFLVVPLLISLGWSEQKIKIEYNKIDVAVFEQPFKGKYNTDPYIIIETKRFEDGLSFTDYQASEYSKNYPTCRTLITTNGFRYKIFDKKEEGFIETAYLSLINLRGGHYLNPTIGGAITALLKMSNFR